MIITTHIVVWNNLLYCTAFPTPSSYGRKTISYSRSPLAPKELTSLFHRIATFFVAFVFVTLVDSEGNWQRYPTAAAMTIFFLLLVWCIWTTWEGRTRFVEWLRRFPRGSPTPNYGPRPPSPLQPNRGQPEQHNGQKTAQFHLIRMDSSRGLTSATQVY